jgi:aconitate hydratase
MANKKKDGSRLDPFGVRRDLRVPGGEVAIYSLEEMEKRGLGAVARLPFSIRILLESVLRPSGDYLPSEADLRRLAGWRNPRSREEDIPFQPARVLMQDFTGVPAVVDLAVMRDALGRLGGDPARINPSIPVDLIIDHSVQVDQYATPAALAVNAGLEFERNRERYEFLRWGAQAFDNFRVVPPATGICHQVNLEYLARVVWTREQDGGTVAYPDTLVGTDSHTTMINGIGVFGFGVGGIEAEAVVVGQPLFMQVPEVIGFRLAGAPPAGITATDLVLTITQQLRRHGVVGKVVEFFGPGLASLSVADRATVSNMCPEFGATAAYFPVDQRTLDYLALTGRPKELIELVERYNREQGLFRTGRTPEPEYSQVLELNLGSLEPSLAGPRRPQDRVPLSMARRSFEDAVPGAPSLGPSPDLRSGRRRMARDGTGASLPGAAQRADHSQTTVPELPDVSLHLDGREVKLRHGSVVIAAITSCTNTSNPAVMVAAGLLARKAVERGLTVSPIVKTSLAPGSRVVTRYLERAGLMPALEALGFHLVGYGCTTCIGNSGPLRPEISEAIRENNLHVAAVLSGNRNFEGRIHADVRLNYLASPPLVVAYGLAGTMNIDLPSDPIGSDREGRPVYLKDLWPANEEIEAVIREVVDPELFKREYAQVFTGNETWNAVRVSGGKRYPWDDSSTYIREPPYFEGLTLKEPPLPEIRGARVLILLGDSITTDHISPAGAIPPQSPAGQWLLEHGVEVAEFNTYGARRGNHEVMMRGTFANIRIRNHLVAGVEGGYTLHLPSASRMSVYDAAMAYAREGVPLLAIAGKEYGTGSSRDWAAKGTVLLGVRAVIAESFERIHRSNLIGMGVLPLQFQPGENALSLELSGREVYEVEPLRRPRQTLRVTAVDEQGRRKTFSVTSRIDTPVEMGYYRGGGILHAALRRLARQSAGRPAGRDRPQPTQRRTT